MGREFHVSPSINEAYYVVEDQRFLRGQRDLERKAAAKEERKKSPIETAFKGLPGWGSIHLVDDVAAGAGQLDRIIVDAIGNSA
jgi:hypothetical protein